MHRFQPKFKRLRIVHQLLWYLLYEHPSLRSSSESNDIISCTVDLDKVNVYLDELSWKRFLPPAPIYKYGGRGWLQLGDVAVILPIIVLCQFHRISYEVDGLNCWLADDVKRFSLVRHLPPNMRSLLFYKRKYIFSLMACVEQLAFMGLLSMRKCGSRNLNNMPKENMMVYVHKNATIFDTQTSSKQHFRVEDKEYDKIPFTFDTFGDVESYWYKLQDVCVQTQIGYSHLQESHYASIKNHLGVTELKKFSNDIFEQEADPVDDGHIPGDQRGAGGLDSSMYSYLYRNWSSANRFRNRNANKLEANDTKSTSETISERLPKLNQKDLSVKPAKKKVVEHSSDSALTSTPHSAMHGFIGGVANKRSAKPRSATSNVKSAKKATKEPAKSTDKGKPTENEPAVITVNNVGRNERVKGGRGVKRKTKSPTLELPMKKLKSKLIERKRRTKVGKRKRQPFDELDLAALSKKKRVRVAFSSAEDTLLLICRVAINMIREQYWSHDPKKLLVPHSVVRDVLHSMVRESMDKTSSAVHRRAQFMLRNPETKIYHDICLADALSDTQFVEANLPKNEAGTFDVNFFSGVFHKLVKNLQSRFHTQPGLFFAEIPDCCFDLHNQYVPKFAPLKKGRRRGRRHQFTDNLDSVIDITRHVVENVIYISLTTGSDEFSIYQAFRTFEFLPEEVISDVFQRMKLCGLVSTKLEMARRFCFGVPSHRITQSHYYTFRASLPPRLLKEIWAAVMLQSGDSEMTMDIDVSHGKVFLLSHMLLKYPTDLTVEVPEQIILPDLPGSPLFENQFLNLMKETQQELTKEMHLETGSESDVAKTSIFPSSLIAAASCLLQADTTTGETELTSNPDLKAGSNSNNDAKLKLTEIMKLYQRHPSYTNWLLLIDPGRRIESKSKFNAINYSVNSDNVVLNPCTVRALRTKDFFETSLANMKLPVLVGGDFDSVSAPVKYQRYLENECVNVLQLLESKKFKYDECELAWKHLQERISLKEKTCLRIVVSEIGSAGNFGIPECDACAIITSKNPITASQVRSAIRTLSESGVLVTVGLKERRLVLYKHAHPWMTRGFRFKGAKSRFQDEISHELQKITAMSPECEKGEEAGRKDAAVISGEGEQEEQARSEVGEPKKSKARKKSQRKEGSVIERWSGLSFKSMHEEVNFLCRPWHLISGEINYKNSKLILLSIYLKIVSSPGITMDKLCNENDFQPICIIELTEILCRAECITRHTVKRRQPPRLFSGPAKQPKETVYFTATVDGLMKMSILCTELEAKIEEYEKNNPS